MISDLDRLGVDIFSPLRMKGHVLHRERINIVYCWPSCLHNGSTKLNYKFIPKTINRESKKVNGISVLYSFCAGVQFSRDFIRVFNDRMREN